MKKYFIILSLFLLSVFTLSAEQTIHGNYRTSNTFYYGKTYPIQILRGIIPTSFYLAFSEDSLQTWTKTSNTFVWGEEYNVTSWTPSGTTTKGYLGVFSGINGVYGSRPYDTTNILTVLPAKVSSLSFTRTSVNTKDNVGIKWSSTLSTMPNLILLQYRELGSTTWTTSQTLSSVKTSATFTNNSRTSTEIRLTYLDGKYTLSSGVIEYVSPTATFSNKQNYLRSFSYDTDLLVSGSYTSYTGLKFYLLTDTLLEITSSSTLSPNGTFKVNVEAPFYNGSKSYTLFVTDNESRVLDNILLSYKNKFLVLSPNKSVYTVNEPITLNWFYSKDVFTDKIIFEKLVDTTWVPEKNWDVATESLTFYFTKTGKSQIRATVSDSYDTITTYSVPFEITEGCKQDSLELVVKGLVKTIAKKDSLLATKTTLIDSLQVLLAKKPKSDTTIIVVEKDLNTNIETVVISKKISDVELATGSGTKIYIYEDGIESVFIYNLVGTLVYTDKGILNNPVTIVETKDLTTGTYILVYRKDNKLYAYKFQK